MSTKLHEILAVESDRESAASAIIAETTTVFLKKPDHFQGKHSIYKSFEEHSEEDADESTKDLVTTVPDKLKHCFSVIARALDVTATKDATNQKAVAAIMVNGTQLTPDLPATTLLMLENRLKRWMELFQAIPTLAPGRPWELDPSKGDFIYTDKAPDTRYRTKKVPMHKVLVEPTEHHPAQIERWTEDVRIGKVIDTVWSGMMSPADKALLINRCQELLAATKQARQRANMTEVEDMKIADKLFAFLIG